MREAYRRASLATRDSLAKELGELDSLVDEGLEGTVRIRRGIAHAALLSRGVTQKSVAAAAKRALRRWGRVLGAEDGVAAVLLHCARSRRPA